MTGAALTDVLDALEYSGDNGLVTTGAVDIEDERAYALQEIRGKFELDAVYFHGSVPVVYFKEFQTIDVDSLLDLHRSLWNHNRAPLLVTVFPQEVRVYNCFASPLPPDSDPSSTENQILLKRVFKQVSDALGEELSDFRRQEIESGRFVQAQPDRFRREQRVDNRLLDNLREVRDRLIRDGLSESITNTLLGRSIFIRYLEDRGAIGEEYYKRISSRLSFYDILDGSLSETYRLFEELDRQFNGDMFPVDEVEREQVKPQHLRRLSDFLRGDDPSGQMYFWAYNFKYIPTELISAIYETFLGARQKSTGSYYTPPEVVDFVLNEVLPFDTEVQRIRILDPACGSGIFLVEAFRRLVILHSKSLDEKRLEFKELSDLLKKSIYGIDTSEDAIQVAAFSCYLALLDFIDPQCILENAPFPKLKGFNLLVNDFFNVDASFNNLSFDFIVGNPPWGGNLTESAADYVEKNQLPIGNKEIAQAFLWRAPTLLADKGRVCLLAPSKGMLFNQSNQNSEFRRQFFTNNEVTKVADFSALRRSLFRNAIAPMVAIFFQKSSGTDCKSDELTYMRLHSSPLSDSLAGIVVYGDEIRQMSYRQIFKHPHIWKVALWGAPRDFVLINDLSERFPSLGDVCKLRNWQIGEGVKVKGKNPKHRPELAKMRYVPTRAVTPFCVSTGHNKRINHEEFERPRDIDIYRGPHVLVRGVALAKGFLAAIFLSEDAVFRDAIVGIAGPCGDRDYLKIVSAFINSSLARYYLFLTASTWGVERDVILLKEYKSLPCPIPTLDSDIPRRIVSLVDQIQRIGTDWNWRPELDELVFRSYGVTPSEQQMIKDFLQTTMDRYYNGLQANAFKKPSKDDLVSYAQAYVEVFAKATGGQRVLQPKVYIGASPYRAVSFTLAQKGIQGGHPTVVSEPGIQSRLVELEKVLTEQKSHSLYTRRNMKVYESDKIHIVKPSEQRFWTKSAAFNDADETIVQLLSTLSLDNDGEVLGLS